MVWITQKDRVAPMADARDHNSMAPVQNKRTGEQETVHLSALFLSKEIEPCRRAPCSPMEEMKMDLENKQEKTVKPDGKALPFEKVEQAGMAKPQEQEENFSVRRAVQRKQKAKQNGYAIYVPGKGPQPVTREVYVYWCKSLRREKYEKEKERKNGVLSYDEYMSKVGDHSRLIPTRGMRSQWGQSVEQALEHKRLREELNRLPEKDQDLMLELYGSQRSLRDIARERNVTHQAISKQRDRILRTLAKNLEDIK